MASSRYRREAIAHGTHDNTIAIPPKRQATIAWIASSRASACLFTLHASSMFLERAAACYSESRASYPVSRIASTRASGGGLFRSKATVASPVIKRLTEASRLQARARVAALLHGMDWQAVATVMPTTVMFTDSFSADLMRLVRLAHGFEAPRPPVPDRFATIRPSQPPPGSPERPSTFSIAFPDPLDAGMAMHSVDGECSWSLTYMFSAGESRKDESFARLSFRDS